MLFVPVMLTYLAVGIGGAVAAGHNGVRASDGLEPELGWAIAGYALGTLGVLGGSALTYLGREESGVVTAGALLGSIGATALAMTIWAQAQPDGLRAEVVPTARFDRSGGWEAGATVRLVGW